MQIEKELFIIAHMSERLSSQTKEPIPEIVSPVTLYERLGTIKKKDELRKLEKGIVEVELSRILSHARRRLFFNPS